jgi:hypothetical protein
VCSVRLPQQIRTVKVKVALRPTVSRPVRLGVRRPSGICDQFFFLLEILFRQLRVCYFAAPSLARGRVCNLLSLLVFASAVPLGSALSDERSDLSSLAGIFYYRYNVFCEVRTGVLDLKLQIRGHVSNHYF